MIWSIIEDQIKSNLNEFFLKITDYIISANFQNKTVGFFIFFKINVIYLLTRKSFIKTIRLAVISFMQKLALRFFRAYFQYAIPEFAKKFSETVFCLQFFTNREV